MARRPDCGSRRSTGSSIKRSELRSLDAFAGTLLHEVAHAVSGTPDVSAAFEDALTAETGTVAGRAIGDPARGD